MELRLVIKVARYFSGGKNTNCRLFKGDQVCIERFVHKIKVYVVEHPCEKCTQQNNCYCSELAFSLVSIPSRGYVRMPLIVSKIKERHGMSNG